MRRGGSIGFLDGHHKHRPGAELGHNSSAAEAHPISARSTGCGNHLLVSNRCHGERSYWVLVIE